MTSLAESGKKKIEWVKKHMKVLNYLKNLYQTEKPFEGVNVAISIHLEAKTAYLGIVLHELGANVAITGSNPLSTKEDVVEALKASFLPFPSSLPFSSSFSFPPLDKILETNPNIILDDG
ncbi:adenosylhomocysteinase, partial [Petrotoga halophila]